MSVLKCIRVLAPRVPPVRESTLLRILRRYAEGCKASVFRVGDDIITDSSGRIVVLFPIVLVVRCLLRVYSGGGIQSESEGDLDGVDDERDEVCRLRQCRGGAPWEEVGGECEDGLGVWWGHGECAQCGNQYEEEGGDEGLLALKDA